MSTKEDENEDVWKERCYNCIRCNHKEDCQECTACKNGKTCEKRRCFSAKKLYDEKVKKMAEENYRQIIAKTAAREAEMVASGSFEVPDEKPEKKKRGRKKGSGTCASKKITERDYVPLRPTRQQSADMRRKRAQLNSQPDKLPRQCLNPDCIYEARDDSKYCSDQCGLALAKLRLTEILPVRCREYFSGPRTHAQEIEYKREQLNKDMNNHSTAEKNLARFLEKMHEHVEKQSKFSPEVAEDRDDDNMYEACVVCGLPDIPLRKYAKHIDLCWSRSEKAISFAASDKTNEAFYCETFDARTKTYCKRLKSLCPEHRKTGLEQCLRICGYPRKWEVTSGDHTKTLSELIESDDPFGEDGCMTKKDLCSKHHKWLPSLRGAIELEQACLFQKVYEVCHEKHKLNTQIEWSTNALSILLHKPTHITDASAFNSLRDSMKSPYPEVPADKDGPSTFHDVDPEMAETAASLIALNDQKEGDASTNTCLIANDTTANATSLHNNQPLLSPTSIPSSCFSVARLLQ